jgi:hypothetical protein
MKTAGERSHSILFSQPLNPTRAKLHGMKYADDFHCFRSDPLIHWRNIADALEANPSAWDWAAANIERWLARGRVHPAPLLEWKKRLIEGCENEANRHAFLSALREPPADAHNEQLRSCSPFVGGPFRNPTLPA